MVAKNSKAAWDKYGVVNIRSVTAVHPPDEEHHGNRLHYKQADREAIEREAAEIVRAAKVTQCIDGIRPVEFADYRADERLLVTYFVEPADSLFNFFWNRTRRWSFRGLTTRQAETIGHRIGTWLREYHNSTSSFADPSVAEIAAVVRRKVTAIQRDPAGILTPAIINRIEKFLSDCESDVPHWSPQRFAKVHGDMDLCNLLIGPRDSLFVLDFADTHDGHAWEDVIRCWNAMWSIAQLSAKRSQLLNTSMNSMIAAYGDEQLTIGHPLVSLLRCLNSVTLILVYAKFMSRYRFGIRLGLRTRAICHRLVEVNLKWLQTLG